MCGIVAVIPKDKHGFSQKEFEVFNSLLYVGQLRGVDGTGIFYNDDLKSRKIKITKGALKSSLMLDTKEYQSSANLAYQRANFLVGHNRAATRGEKTIANTHPFKEGHITLVHNGTLLSQRELHPEATVDSHAICHSMGLHGEINTLEKINGAFALVWFNSKTGNLNFCRNSERPLHIIDCDTCTILVSEVEMGEWIAIRNGMIIKSKKEVALNKLYSVSVNDTSVIKEIDYKYKAKESFNSEHNRWTTYKYQPSNNRPTYQQGARILSTKTFKFGERVRFCAGALRSTVDRENTGVVTYFLEGDILKHQQQKPTEHKYLADYEDEFRVRVYGSKETLLKFQGQNNLVGKVTKTYINGGREIYYISDVSILPVENFKPKCVCDWCDAPSNKLKVVDDFEVCSSCAISWGYTGAAGIVC